MNEQEHTGNTRPLITRIGDVDIPPLYPRDLFGDPVAYLDNIVRQSQQRAQEDEQFWQQLADIDRRLSNLEQQLDAPGNLEAELAHFYSLLHRRQQYQEHGRPCPTELPNVPAIISALERMKPTLKGWINTQLEQQARGAIHAVTDTYLHTLTNPSAQFGNRNLQRDMPQTPAEKLLAQATAAQEWAESDFQEQRNQEERLDRLVYCGPGCPYPDVCRIDVTGNGFSRYRGTCVLYQLGSMIEASGWKRLLGQRFEPADNAFVLSRIRSSYFYDSRQDSCIECISRPSLNRWHKGCWTWEGQDCLLRLQADQWADG